MRRLTFIITFSYALWGNDSFYTSNKDEKVIYKDKHVSEFLLESPQDYNVTLHDGGGFTRVLKIGKYSFETDKVPKIIEWRINEKKEIIGAIVRVYTVTCARVEAFSKQKYNSKLHVLFFDNEPVLLGTTTSNRKARTLIDNYTKKRGGLKTYGNARFKFFINYPSDIFVNKKYPENGDGVQLTSQDSKVKLTVSGHYAVLAQNIQEAYENYIEWKEEKKDTLLTYKIQRKNWFVLSGYKNNKKTIFYEKRIFHKTTLVGYTLEYPTKEKEKYSKLINVLNKTFRHGE